MSLINAGELASAVRSKTDLRFGVYHSLFEWFNPLYIQDFKHLFTTDDYVTVSWIFYDRSFSNE